MAPSLLKRRCTTIYRYKATHVHYVYLHLSILEARNVDMQVMIAPWGYHKVYEKTYGKQITCTI